MRRRSTIAFGHESAAIITPKSLQRKGPVIHVEADKSASDTRPAGGAGASNHVYAQCACHERKRTRRRRPGRVTTTTADQATIGKSLVIKGEVTGSESLYIDGRVEGSINLSGNRVTVGRNGVVAANINAREIVVLGRCVAISPPAIAWISAATGR